MLHKSGSHNKNTGIQSQFPNIQQYQTYIDISGLIFPVPIYIKNCLWNSSEEQFLSSSSYPEYAIYHQTVILFIASMNFFSGMQLSLRKLISASYFHVLYFWQTLLKINGYGDGIHLKCHPFVQEINGIFQTLSNLPFSVSTTTTSKV